MKFVLPTKDKAIDALPLPKPAKGDPIQQRYTKKDGERGLSLVLVVSHKGTKSFNVRYYENGVAKTFQIGKRPEMSIKDAWKKARELRQDPAAFLANDPRNKKKQDANNGTFEAVAEMWFSRHVEKERLKTAPEIRRILKTYIYPQWAKTPFMYIRRKEVDDLIQSVMDRKKHATFRKDGSAQADAVLGVIGAICRWYGDVRDENYRSPVTARLKRHRNKKSRDRVLSDEEISLVWNADYHPAFMDILRLCLLTAQRRTKVTSMKWSDIKDGVWTIAVENEDNDKGTAGILKLPKAAIDILDRQPRLFKSPWVFPVSGGKHFTAFGTRKKELDQILPKMPPWVVHDLRRTAKTLMVKHGVQTEISERVLGHVQGGIEAVYNKYKYTDEKAQALQILANAIQAIISQPPDNVVSLPNKLKAVTTAA